MSQHTVFHFRSLTERDTALAGLSVPAGVCAYIADTHVLELFNGEVWLLAHAEPSVSRVGSRAVGSRQDVVA